MQATNAFPHCVLANWATEFLLKTDDTAWKLQFSCIAVTSLLGVR
jgi:hypothetical protein